MRLTHLKTASVLTGVMLLIAACVAGCKIVPVKPVDRTATVTTHTGAATTQLSAVSVEHAAARADLATIIKTPSLPAPVVTAAKSADTHVARAEVFVRAATTQVAAADAGAVKLGAEDLETQGKLAKAQNRINALESQFFSPRQKRDFWLLVGVIGFYAFVMGAVKVFGGTYPALTGVYHLLLIPVTFGFSIFHAVGTWFGMGVHALAAHLTAATPTPAK